jgi:hypothetical protein
MTSRKLMVRLSKRSEIATTVFIVAPPGLELLPVRYSFTALGGPDEAQLIARGTPYDVWQLVHFLRSQVIISDWRGDKVWWGYLSGVTISCGAIQFGVDLDGMYNKIAVAYTVQTTDPAAGGGRDTTSWASNSDSIAAYGTKELLLPVSEASSSQAEAMRDGALEDTGLPGSGITPAEAEAVRELALPELARPLPVISHRPEGNELEARLRCRGWWYTLGWNYYSNDETDSVATTTQISDIISAVGQFVTSVRVEDASGINSCEYRSGDNTALDIIMELLDSGTSNGKRLMAQVLEPTSAALEHKLRVYEMPDKSDWAYQIGADGRVISRWQGQRVEHKPPVGEWCRLRDVYPPEWAPDLSVLASPEYLFIESSEFDVQNWRLRVRAMAAPNPWQLGEVRRG